MIMGVITTGIISFTLITINVGLGERFLAIWLRAWATAYLVAIPAILIIAPQVQKLVDRLFAPKEEPEANRHKAKARPLCHQTPG